MSSHKREQVIQEQVGHPGAAFEDLNEFFRFVFLVDVWKSEVWGGADIVSLIIAIGCSFIVTGILCKKIIEGYPFLYYRFDNIFWKCLVYILVVPLTLLVLLVSWFFWFIPLVVCNILLKLPFEQLDSSSWWLK